MRPVFAEAEEEIFAGDDEDFARFQPLVEFARGDAQSAQPEPVEECAFARVQRPVHMRGIEEFARPRGGGAAFLLVERTQDARAEFQNLAALDPRQRDLLTHVAIRETGDGGHRREGGCDFFRRDDDGRARAGEAEL